MMDKETLVGLFTLAGTVAGGVVGAFGAVIAARIDRKWDKAKKDIVRLCDQVAAYHKLEELYSTEVVRLDPSKGQAKTIMIEMRSAVEATGEFVYPKMTSREARLIQNEWV